MILGGGGKSPLSQGSVCNPDGTSVYSLNSWKLPGRFSYGLETRLRVWVEARERSSTCDKPFLSVYQLTSLVFHGECEQNTLSFPFFAMPCICHNDS